MKLVEISSKRREFEDTSKNSRSSRSHIIFQLDIRRCEEGKGERRGMLNIIDLAGNERGSRETHRDKTSEEVEKMKKIQIEGGFINKSLTSLGRILKILGERIHKKDINIPYRENKLTKILASSLQPNSKTVMFLNICPQLANYRQTKESLLFANNAAFV